jgi:hypothetical protein
MTPISDERLQRMINDAIDEGESDNLVSALTELQSLRAQGGARVEEDGDTECHIDDLRLRAFQTNADADKEAYLRACSKWFQDRHFRRMVRSSLEASPAPVSEELVEKDVDAIRDHAARILDRMGKTPHGPKRKLLAAQHVDLTNEALRAEGWNAALKGGSNV